MSPGLIFCILSQYNFEGRYDLLRFVKTVQRAGLYVHLRIGPYVCAEWNFGYYYDSGRVVSLISTSSLLLFLRLFRGFPVWLKYVPGISFRTDNEPFKVLSSF